MLLLMTYISMKMKVLSGIVYACGAHRHWLRRCNQQGQFHALVLNYSVPITGLGVWALQTFWSVYYIWAVYLVYRLKYNLPYSRLSKLIICIIFSALTFRCIGWNVKKQGANINPKAVNCTTSFKKNFVVRHSLWRNSSSRN